MNYQRRNVLACAMALTLMLAVPAVARAEEAGDTPQEDELVEILEPVEDDDEELPAQAGDTLEVNDQEVVTDDQEGEDEPSDQVDEVATDEEPADEEAASNEEPADEDGQEEPTEPEAKIPVTPAEPEPEPEVETEPEATVEDSSVSSEVEPEVIDEDEPQLTVAATEEEEPEVVPVDGWADETLASGKKGRVYYRNGEKLLGYKTINRKGYFFDEKTGFVLTNATKVVNGKLCLFGADGARVTGSGWKQVGGKKYWLASSVVKNGWLEQGGKWYYLAEQTGALCQSKVFTVGGTTYVADASGVCPANAWVQIGKKWYLTDGSCAARGGWVQSGGTWYYLDPTSKVMKASQTFKVGGKTYIATASGACPADSWVLLNKKWYLTDESCALRAGWAEVDGTWYYLDPKTFAMKSAMAFVVGGKTYVAKESGACPANAWVKAGNYWYLTDGSCAARTGWVQDGSTWYYLNPKKDAKGISGKMMTGLVTLSGKSYFLKSSGAMAASEFVTLPDGREAYAGSDGAIGGYEKNGVYYNADGSVATGWMKVDGSWYYLNNQGRPTTGWLKVDGKWYWFDSNGKMVTGERTIDGKTYYFEASGAWVDENAVRNAIVAAAYSQIGAAYTEANDYYEKDVAFNCSGFSYWCYKEAGYTVPRKQGYYSYYWNEENKEYSQMWWVESRGNWTTDVSNLEKGDLVFFSPINDKYHTGHVGVYVGDSMMIDAFPGYGVSKRSVWQSGFVGGGSPIF